MKKPVEKRIAFKNMEHSAVLEEFANKKLEKIEKLLETERLPIRIELVIECSHVHAHQKVELIVHTADYCLMANHEGPDIYIEIKKVMDKMLEEVRTAKDEKAKAYKKKDTYRSA